MFMSKKIIMMAAVMACSSLNVMAGGLLTNTNQNAAFLRNFAQEGQITLTSLYANPAGNAFLSQGWHLTLNSQSAWQERKINTTFPLFALNQENPGQTTHEFVGEATAPVIPSFSVSHNWERWSLSAHFALNGGGGKCEFNKGLGSFEALYAGTLYQQVPGMVNAQLASILPTQVTAGLVQAGVPEPYASALAATTTYGSQLSGYNLDAYMKGRSYYFGLQIGGSYKILDNLAGYIGVRGLYATCNYNGYVQDISANYAYSYEVPANAALGFPGTSGVGGGQSDLSSHSLAMNCDQTGIGFTPIFGLDWKINNQWNVAIKYEAPTRMTLKNKSEMNNFAQSQAESDGSALAQFKDGEKVREDIPAILAAGAEYSPIEKLRLDASAKVYFDKSARKYGNKEDLIDNNTWEVALGAEYDLCKLVTVSASWQSTNYGLNDKYMNDLSFNLSSNSLGLGVRLHPSKYFNVDLGYMHTMYGDRTVDTQTAAGVKSDVYSRKNDVIGVGVNLFF